MDRLLDTKRRFRHMACPECGSAGSLKTAIRCELAHGECLYTVRCQTCGLVFELRTAMQSPRLFQPELYAWLSRLVCPACKGARSELVFRCDVPSRPCFYLVRCAHCGHEYTAEQSAGQR